MSKKFTFTNNAPAEESAVKCDYNLAGGYGIEEKANPGAQTGPYGDGLKENSISIPVPASNLQIEVGAGKSVVIETAKLKEIVFYEEYIKEVADDEGITAVEEDVPDPVGGDFTITYLTGAIDIASGSVEDYEFVTGHEIAEITTVNPTSGSYSDTITSDFEYVDTIESMPVLQKQYIAVTGDIDITSETIIGDIFALLGSDRLITAQNSKSVGEPYTELTESFVAPTGEYTNISVFLAYIVNSSENPGE